MNGFDDLEHKGKAHKRLNLWNPKEISFAHMWEKENKDHNMLDKILTDDPHKFSIPRVSEDVRTSVATVIQWLGTNVGQDFLGKCQKDIVKRRDQFKTAQRASQRLSSSRGAQIEEK